MLALAQPEVPSLSLSTVYRQIKAMQEDGQITAVELPGLPPRYELAVPAAGSECPVDCDVHGQHHHDEHGHIATGPGPSVDRHRHHFHCTACDEVTPIDACPGGIDALAPNGWQVDRHDITLHGRCGKCLTAGSGALGSGHSAASLSSPSPSASPLGSGDPVPRAAHQHTHTDTHTHTHTPR